MTETRAADKATMEHTKAALPKIEAPNNSVAEIIAKSFDKAYLLVLISDWIMPVFIIVNNLYAHLEGLPSFINRTKADIAIQAVITPNIANTISTITNFNASSYKLFFKCQEIKFKCRLKKVVA